MKKLYVVISAGRRAEDARPVAASSNPAVAQATLKAIVDEMESPGGGESDTNRRELLELVRTRGSGSDG